MAHKQLRHDRPSLLLSSRAPDETIEEAYEKAIAKIESGPVPEFSGRRLFERDPKKYTAICKAIAEGLSTTMIANGFSVSHNTVQAVRLREPLELEKTRLLDLVRSASRLCTERLIELIPTMSPRDAAIASGILIEKSLLLGGDPIHITLNKNEQISHTSFNDLLSQLPQANARVVCNSPGEVEDKPGAGA